MHPIEFSQVRAVFEANAPRRCLEWGAGGSTRAALETFPFIERYVSIEHDRAWYEKVKNTIADPRLSLHLLEPEIAPPPPRPAKALRDWAQQAERDSAMFTRYIEFPRSLNEAFDLVLVDGRARCFCLPVAYELLVAGGIIVIHDAQREMYHPVLSRLGRSVFLEPWVEGQVCLLRKN